MISRSRFCKPSHMTASLLYSILNSHNDAHPEPITPSALGGALRFYIVMSVCLAGRAHNRSYNLIVDKSG